MQSLMIAIGVTKRGEDVESTNVRMPEMTPKKVAMDPRFLVAILLLLCFTLAAIQPLRSAAFLQRLSSSPKNPTGGAAAKESSEKSEVSAQSSGAGGVPRIALGEISGSPGASLMIPLYYIPSANEPLRSFAVDIDYVSVHLKFQKAALGLIPDNIKAEVTSNVIDNLPDEKGTIRSRVHVAVSVDKNTPQGLPAGLLSYLLFDVTLDAKPFKITLNPAVVSAEALKDTAKKPVKVSVVAGTVVVVVPDTLPETTCFFFSH